MPVTEDQQREPGSARETINQMLDAGLLDDVMARADSGELALTGDGGFLPEMIKAVLERGLAAEPTGHLGDERGDPAGRGSPNSRNGTTFTRHNGRRCSIVTPCCSVSRWAINERWQASGSRSTQSSAADPLLDSADTIGVRSALSRISVV